MESSKEIPNAPSICLDLSVIPNSWNINQEQEGKKGYSGTVGERDRAEEADGSIRAEGRSDSSIEDLTIHFASDNLYTSENPGV